MYVCTQYYTTFVPQLKEIIKLAASKDLRVLRGRAMNCLCTIGISVGKEIFARDALEVMQEMVAVGGVLEADDPQIDYLESSFVMVAECLGKDFTPFLPTVLPATFQRAEMKPDVQQIDLDNTEDLQEGWDLIGTEDEVHTQHIHTIQYSYNTHSKTFKHLCSVDIIIIIY